MCSLCERLPIWIGNRNMFSISIPNFLSNYVHTLIVYEHIYFFYIHIPFSLKLFYSSPPSPTKFLFFLLILPTFSPLFCFQLSFFCFPVLPLFDQFFNKRMGEKGKKKMNKLKKREKCRKKI